MANIQLNNLSPKEGSKPKKTRVGRGIGSGKGKTSGSGMKGQKARSGVAINGFEGGQMPIHRRLPKRGFKNPNRKQYEIINLGQIEKALAKGTISASKTITKEILKSSGLISNKEDILVKLLAKGELKKKVSIEVDAASEKAISAVEQEKGSVKLINKPK